MHKSVQQTLQRLADTGVIPVVGSNLDSALDEAKSGLYRAILKEVEAFSTSANPDILPGLANHSAEHVHEIERLLQGGEASDFAFVTREACLRAEQRFPLEAILHAYRIGHRHCLGWLRDTALQLHLKHMDEVVSAIADFTVEYTNVISAIATSAYVAHARFLAETEGDQRSELMDILLGGYDESDGRVASLLKRAGYLEQRQAYCIVAAQATNANEMTNPHRAQRIATAITDATTGTSIRCLAAIRGDIVVAVLNEKRRQSGWTAPRSKLADRLRPLLDELGTAVLVGISADHPSTSFIPKALQEARLALDLATVARRVVQFSAVPLRELLLHHGREHLLSTPPAWIGAFAEANTKANGALVETLRAVAASDLNMQKAARRLRKHPNTVYVRLEKISEITGLNGQGFDDLTELLLAADCWQSAP